MFRTMAACGVLALGVVSQPNAGAAQAITGDTTFRIASLTKTFTAAAIVRLAQDGRLAFQDPLSRFYPEFPNGERISVEQLLRHTAGVGDFDTPNVYLKFSTIDDLTSRVARVKPRFAPGTDDQYSNEGYVLLAKIIQVASGKPYAQYLHDTFLGPLAMKHTELDKPDPDPGIAEGNRAVLGGTPLRLERNEAPLFGASGLVSSAHDLYAWMKGLRAGTVVNSSALTTSYGWGKRNYQGHPLLEQSGEVEGYGSYIATYEDGHYVVCLSNVQSGMQGRWGPDFASVIFGGVVSQPPHITRTPSTRNVAEFEGEYRNDSVGNPFRLRMDDGRLMSTWGPFPFWRPVSTVADDELFIVADYTRLIMRRGPDRKIIGLAMPGLDDNDSAKPLEFTKVK